MQEKLNIGYDPIYNFHPGYHGEIVDSTKMDFNWLHSIVVNDYEQALLAVADEKRKKYLSVGKIINVSGQTIDWVFSPHLLIPEIDINGPSIFMELEDSQWLFADTYEETASTILPEKIHIYEESISNPQLQRIFWWSQEAMNRFNIFCEQYQVQKEVREKITTISSVVYPVSAVVERNILNTEKNRFIAVFNEGNFYRKGGDVILSVFDQLEDDGINNWALTIVGGIPSGLTLRIPKDVTILPRMNRDRLQHVIADSDIFVFPSRADTFGTVLIEALNTNCFIISSCGKSVIASKECLKKYPNSILIDNFRKSGVYDDIDKNAFFESIRDLIINPSFLLPYNSPYTKSEMNKRIVNAINKRV